MIQRVRTVDMWAAGIVDGEGCIRIRATNKGRYYQLSVVVGQSSANLSPILSKLQETYGGSISKAGRKPHRKQQRNWEIVGRGATEFLRAVEPYIVGKKTQVALGVEFINYVGLPGQRRTASNLEQQHRIYLELSALKKL